MGMDLYGKKPKDETGAYFRRNVWGWHPLWTYVEDNHPDIASKVNYAHSNDGDGLNSVDSKKLAIRLKKDISSGIAAAYVVLRDQELKNLPDIPCDYCEQTGNRTWNENGLKVVKVCNGCDGKKTRRPFATHYYLELEDIKDFANFLEKCGGFEIW